MSLQSSLDSMEFPELTTEFQRIKYDKEEVRCMNKVLEEIMKERDEEIREEIREETNRENAKVALSKGLDKATVKDIFGLSLEEIGELATEDSTLSE